MKLITDLGMLYPTINSKQKKRFAIYQCDCGNEFKTQIVHIKNNLVKSCGCLKSKNISIMNIKHGLRNHRLYSIWKNMISRCTNPKAVNYEKYGAKGITVCERWLSVSNFIEDMYPSFVEGLSLDRKNNDLGYSIDNCRWVTKTVQSRNRDKQKRNTLGFKGVKKNKSSFNVRIGVNYKLINLGSFNTAEEAGRAYDKYVIDNNLEHSLNFSYN